MSAIGKTKVALQLWSLNKYEPENFPAVLKKVAELGYDGIEFAGFHNMPAADLKKMVTDLGLGIAGSHTGIQLLREKFDETIDYNLALGNKYIVVPGVGDDVRSSMAGWDKFADEMKGYSTKLKAKGLVLGYHNHDFEFVALEGKIPFYHLFSALPAEVLMQVDMGWSFRAGHDARDIFTKYPGRSQTVHVKAFSEAVDTACLGEDDVPWADVLPVAVATGKAEWFIVEHERHAGEPIANVKTCLDFIRKLQK